MEEAMQGETLPEESPLGDSVGPPITGFTPATSIPDVNPQQNFCQSEVSRSEVQLKERRDESEVRDGFEIQDEPEVKSETPVTSTLSQMKPVNPSQISWMGTCETSPPAEVLSCQKLEASLQMQSLRSFQAPMPLSYPAKYGLNERVLRQHEVPVEPSRAPLQQQESTLSRDLGQFGVEPTPSNYYQRHQPNTEDQFSQLNQAALEPPVTHFLAQACADPALYQHQNQYPNQNRKAPLFRQHHHSSAGASLYRQSHLSAEAPPFCHQAQAPDQSAFQPPNGTPPYLPNQPPVDAVLYQQPNPLPVDAAIFQRQGEAPVYHQSIQSAPEGSLYHQNRQSVDASLYHQQNQRPNESSVYREPIPPEGPIYHRTVTSVEASLYRNQRRAEASMYHQTSQATAESSIYHHTNQPTTEGVVYPPQEAALYHHSNSTMPGAQPHFLHQGHNSHPPVPAFYHQNQTAPEGTTFYRYPNQPGETHYQRPNQTNTAFHYLQNHAAAEAQFRHQQNQSESSFHLLQNQRPAEPQIQNSGPVDVPFYHHRGLDVDGQLCHQNHPVSEAQVFQYQNQATQETQLHQNNHASNTEVPVFQYQNQVESEAQLRQQNSTSMELSMVNYQNQAAQENQIHPQNHTRPGPSMYEYQSPIPQNLQLCQQNHNSAELPMYPYQNQTTQERLLHQPSLVFSETPACHYQNQSRDEAQFHHHNQRGSPLKPHQQSVEVLEANHVHSKKGSAETGLLYSRVAPDKVQNQLSGISTAVSPEAIAAPKHQSYHNNVITPQQNGHHKYERSAFHLDRGSVHQHNESNDQYAFKFKCSDEHLSFPQCNVTVQSQTGSTKMEESNPCASIKHVAFLQQPDFPTEIKMTNGSDFPDCSKVQPAADEIFLNGNLNVDESIDENLAPMHEESVAAEVSHEKSSEKAQEAQALWQVPATPEPNENIAVEVNCSDEDTAPIEGGDFDYAPPSNQLDNDFHGASYYEGQSSPPSEGSGCTSPTQCSAEAVEGDVEIQVEEQPEGNPSPDNAQMSEEEFSASNVHLLPRPPDILLTLPIDDESDNSAPGNQPLTESAPSSDNDHASTPSVQLSQEGSDESGVVVGLLFDGAEDVDFPPTPPPTPPLSPPLLTPPCETPPPCTPPLPLCPLSSSPHSSTVSSPRSSTPPFSSPLPSSPRTGEGVLQGAHLPRWEHFKSLAGTPETRSELLPQSSLARALDMLTNETCKSVHNDEINEIEQSGEVCSSLSTEVESSSSSQTFEETSSCSLPQIIEVNAEAIAHSSEAVTQFPEAVTQSLEAVSESSGAFALSSEAATQSSEAVAQPPGVAAQLSASSDALSSQSSSKMAQTELEAETQPKHENVIPATQEESLSTDHCNFQPSLQNSTQSFDQCEDQKQDLNREKINLVVYNGTASDELVLEQELVPDQELIPKQEVIAEQHAVSSSSEQSSKISNHSPGVAAMSVACVSAANSDASPACAASGLEYPQQDGAESLSAGSPRPLNPQQGPGPIQVHGFLTPISHCLKL